MKTTKTLAGSEKTGAARKNRAQGKLRQLLRNPALNQKLDHIEKRLTDTVLLSFEKVVAHLENPSKYPLPADSGSVERAFHEVLEALPRGKRKQAVEKINETLKANVSQRRAIYQDLVDVDFSSRTSIVEQARALVAPPEMKLTQAEATEIVALQRNVIEKPSRTIAVRIPNKKQPQLAGNLASKISLFVDSMTCLKTDDRRKDEISLVGFAIDTAGNGQELAPQFIGKFREGETVSLKQNSKLFTLNVDNTNLASPQTFVAGLFIIESDLIDNLDLLLKLKSLFLVISLALSVGATTLIFLVPGFSFLLFAAMLFGGGVFFSLGNHLELFLADVSATVTDTLTFIGQIAVDTTFDRTIQIDQSGFNFGADFDGKYSLAARWVAEQ